MGRMSRRGFTVAAAGAMTVMLATGEAGALPASGAGGAQARKREFRGMWAATVVNVDWPSRPGLAPEVQRAELLALFDAAVARRLNAVLLQIRPTADAFWPSRYEPWSEYLTGTQGRSPGWDPLAFAVREAHKRRLELHGWFNPYRIANHTDPGRLVPGHPARVHPEWAVRYGGKLYYNPGLPEVRRFVQDAMLDAVWRYDLDGVHFDDYFYPYPVAGQVFDDTAAYQRYGAGFPDRAAWRRDNIDRLVRETRERIKKRKRHVRFGVSPFAVWRNRATDPLGSDTRAGVQTYDDLYADTRRWVREGWIDYIVPQCYWHIGFPVADYAKLVPWWARTVRGTDVHLYIGEALYRAGDPAQPAPWQDPAELSRHIALGRAHPEVLGNVYFSAKQVAADRIGAMARVVKDHYPHRARPPR
ncbi:glycoside hydrolase family 10 protein [Streptomyces sp. NPDC053079]|uniref:glycoside hydrolase family 10 protein n=1 Tax=Streptomyces sp. NPDC053079 TaxID=3365697 RepID=UPI0037D7DF22